jgi:hypothetical protein
MWLECQYSGRTAGCPGEFARLADHGLVAEMDAVKISECDNAPFQTGGNAVVGFD